MTVNYTDKQLTLSAFEGEFISQVVNAWMTCKKVYFSLKQFIKYVSEMTIVRDCVPTCSEKEFWGARTFCCSRDACNTGAAPAPLAAAICAAALVLYATR
ncbi:hypothetical protein MSG28_014356 [Choristoneura fumiferana]|uniref:Uncharacterized protein n=1 Tax=Choristoneura fumiferana TaxID=7141 RepID=A0ACC0JGW7_CHOFU|nr:hypothetical protein MSG28_014356 [Choristoneura fumiferana]